MPLIKLNRRGQGVGDGPVGYLLSSTDHKGNERDPLPEILSGEPFITIAAIDSSEFKHRYISGTIAYSIDDAPTFKQQKQAMEDCEALWFAGIDNYKERIPILWVRHEDKDRVELNFVIPRIDLDTGKSFNPCPPGCEYSHDALVDKWVAEHPNFISPRSSELRQNAKPVFYGKVKVDKKQLQAVIEQAIDDGDIFDRNSMLEYLSNAGFKVTRAGDDYVSVNDGGGKNIRLKGGVFDINFHAVAYKKDLDLTDDVPSLAGACVKLQAYIDKRKIYNAKRYPVKPIVQLEETITRWQAIATKIQVLADFIINMIKNPKAVLGAESLTEPILVGDESNYGSVEQLRQKRITPK